MAVSAGRLTLTIGSERYDLEAGDAISYAGDCEHRFANTGPLDCVYYLALVE